MFFFLAFVLDFNALQVQSAVAGPKRIEQDKAQLWRFEGRALPIQQQKKLYQAEVQKALDQGKHQDSALVYRATLRDAEWDGQYLGALILDAQVLESMIASQYWGSGGNSLSMGSPWSISELSNLAAGYRDAARQTAQHYSNQMLWLFSASAFKFQSQGQSSALLWQGAAQARILGDRAAADLLVGRAQAVDRVDLQPLTLSLMEREYPVTPEFMREILFAFWKGLEREVPHLLPAAQQPFERVQAVLRLSAQLKEAKAFGTLDGSDVEQSCAAALAYQKRN